MRILQLIFRRQTIVPMLALLFGSIISVTLVIARIVWTRELHCAGLVWNLFLAWIPLVFALLAQEQQRQGKKPGWRFIALGTAWLLFFPNAPYIFTDIIHLTDFYTYFWIDLMLILITALTGLIIGFVSLYVMQSAVNRISGELASWLFIAAVALLSGFGICLGRFLRLNSWDVIMPWKIFDTAGRWTIPVPNGPGTILFSLLFGAFIFVAYLMLYALTHLSPHRTSLTATDDCK
jgi:uncharacterized membrane protein